jgi:hypothetical protein
MSVSIVLSRTCVASLSPHSDKTPHWFFGRMVKLAGEIRSPLCLTLEPMIILYLAEFRQLLRGKLQDVRSALQIQDLLIKN